MSIENIKNNNLIKSAIVVGLITLVWEIFAFNFSTWYSKGAQTITLATDVVTASTASSENVEQEEFWTYETETFEVNCDVRNVEVKGSLYYDQANIFVILTDAGDECEYITPSYSMVNGAKRSGFSNIYPFGEVHTIKVRVETLAGCPGYIDSITANAHIPLDMKPIRMLVVFMIIWCGYLAFSKSSVHEVYCDRVCAWQWVLTLAIIVIMMVIGVKLSKSDKLLLTTPWPHHKQYQELARSLKQGTVEMIEQTVDQGLLEAANPYDTIALYANGVDYAREYAFYNGKYYAYFGIVPEILFYYPCLLITGQDLQNHHVMGILSILLVLSVFWLVAELIGKYAKSFPYFYYLIISVAATGSANFVYLIARPDIYNVPILAAVTFTIFGMACWLEVTSTKKIWIRRSMLCLGALSMALVAGCRPQLLLLSGVALIWLFFEDGWKSRKLFTKATLVDTVLFVLPYVLVAILVCWYNFARFGNILDFGATYSLTTNDMNNRGFNMNRLLRSLYCFLLQPANINTDYPYLMASEVGGNYIGRFLREYTYGGILVANAMMMSLWIGLVAGFKKVDKNIKILVIYLLASALIIASFDANGAGVIYRYTCDFAPAFIIAAVIMWIVFLDKSRNVINYYVAARIAYICVVVALAYTLLTFVASGGEICLENDNKQLFYMIGDYFKF